MQLQQKPRSPVRVANVRQVAAAARVANARVRLVPVRFVTAQHVGSANAVPTIRPVLRVLAKLLHSAAVRAAIVSEA